MTVVKKDQRYLCLDKTWCVMAQLSVVNINLKMKIRLNFDLKNWKSNRKVNLENHDDPTQTGITDVHKRPSIKSTEYKTLGH